MKRLLLLVASTLLVSTSYSQYVENVDYSIGITENMPKAASGTYQFIIIEPKYNPAFTTDILYFIERERHETQDRVISISNYVDLYIPSREKITKKDFLPLEEFQK
jgi:hypothetical protein